MKANKKIKILCSTLALMVSVSESSLTMDDPTAREPLGRLIYEVPENRLEDWQKEIIQHSRGHGLFPYLNFFDNFRNYETPQLKITLTEKSLDAFYNKREELKEFLKLEAPEACFQFKLELICLDHKNIDLESLSNLLGILSPGIESLEIKRGRINSNFINCLKESVEDSCPIESLSISQCIMNNSHLNQLAQWWGSFPNLKHIAIPKNNLNITDEFLDELRESFANLNSLESLDFSGNRFSNKNYLSYLFDNYKSLDNFKLNKINISENNFDHDTIIDLGRFLVKTELKSFKSNKIIDKDIFNSLEVSLNELGSKGVSSIDIRGMKLGSTEQGNRLLRMLLTEFKSLRHLKIGGNIEGNNKINVDSFLTSYEDRIIKTIYLEGCELSQDKLCAFLDKNNGIQKLSLKGSTLRGSYQRNSRLFSSIEGLNDLECLNLKKNSLTYNNSDVKSLIRSLSSKNIRKIKLDRDIVFNNIEIFNEFLSERKSSLNLLSFSGLTLEDWKSINSLMQYHIINLKNCNFLQLKSPNKELENEGYKEIIISSLWDGIKEFEYLEQVHFPSKIFRKLLNDRNDIRNKIGNSTLRLHRDNIFDIIYVLSGLGNNYSGSIEILEEAEQRGCEDGWMFNTLGLSYNNGTGGAEQNYHKANTYFEKAHENGDMHGTRNLGLNYYYGRGVRKDDIKARELLEAAERKGCKDGEMLRILGLCYDKGTGGVAQDYRKANSYFEKAHKNGDAWGAKYLGMNYYYGRGNSELEYKVLQLLEVAERSGYQDGEMLNIMGYICSKDNYKNSASYYKANSYFEKANAYFQKDYQEGDAWGARNLGVNYYYARGMSKDERKARELLEEAERRGCKDGEMFRILGLCYDSGRGEVTQDYRRANDYFEKARQKNDAWALRYLGRKYYLGNNGVEKDEQKAWKLFEEAAERGCEDVWMLDLLRVLYTQGKSGIAKNPKKADQYFDGIIMARRAITTGQLGVERALKCRQSNGSIYYIPLDPRFDNDKEAVLNLKDLGISYLNGEPEGVQKDEKKALEIFKEAEERGLKDGWMFNQMGILYENNPMGWSSDYIKAKEYFEKSCQEGYAEASYNLGRLYYEDKIKEERWSGSNKTQAREFFEKAEQRGYNNGWMLTTLGDIYTEYGNMQHKLGNLSYNTDDLKARAYYEKACGKGDAWKYRQLYWQSSKLAREEGNAWGSKILGYYYYYGLGVEKDKRKAIEFFEEAAIKGCNDGWMFLEIGLSYHGKDYEKANIYYEKAWRVSDVWAPRYLGKNYFYGRGVQENKTKALELFESAENRGCDDGEMFNLIGCIYYDGIVLAQDRDKAKQYFEKARVKGYAAASFNLRLYYYYGLGVEKDERKAMELSEEAKNRGYNNVEEWKSNRGSSL